MSGPQPQQPYGQPGAGPSNYYPPMPMHYGYPNPQNPYGYPYIPGPTPMDQPPPPAPHSPRLNGASRGGFHPRGGAPAFQPYPQHAHHVPPQHYMHPPPPHQHQLHPHPHAGRISPLAYGPPQKYPGPPQAHPTPYSPHHYPAPYSPVWTPQHQHPQQPLSPLPKQLSMLPSVSSPRISSPRSPRIPFERPAQPSLAVPPSESAPPLPTEPSTPPSQDVTVETASVEKQPESEAEAGSQSQLVSDRPEVKLRSDPQPHPVPKLSPAPSSRAEMKASSPLAFSAPLGSQDQQPSSPSPAAFSSPPASPAPATSTALSFGSTIDVGGWAIWSRRPTNPSSAPGIIISPRARPPPHVVSGALEVRTPPGSPKVIQTDENRALDGSPAAMKESSQSSDLPPSSSATETETTPASSLAANTPTAGSPASTNTSVSLAHAQAPAYPSKDGATTAQATAAVAPAVSEGPSTSSSTPAAPETAPSDSMPPSASVPAVRKSWASLLRPSGSGSATPKAGNALPTSSVIGFSIPAENIGSAVSSPSATGPYSSANVLPPALVSLLTSGPPSQAGAMRIRPRGLINTGNMCFANAVLQVLIYCPPFHALFTQLGKVLPGPVVGSQKETMGNKATPLVDATISFLKEFIPTADKEGRQKDNSRERGKDQERRRAGKNREVSAGDDEEWGLDSFIPTGIYDAMKEKKRFSAMGGGHQEDAEEFLGFYLDTLEEELLSILSPVAPSAQLSKPASEDQDVKPATQEDGWLEVGKRNRSVVTRTAKSTESPITRIFGGKFRSTLRTPHQKDSVVVEDWRALQLDIQREQVHTIKDAVQCISLPQPVQITMPTRPGHVIDATQHVLIDALPSILVLHMKRFLYDTKVGDVVKVGKKVAFEPELLIPSDVMAPARKTGPQARYKLFGVLYHHGQSASGGHYTLDVLHPNRDLSTKPREAWIRIDDELVSDVRPEDVFGGLERDDRCAYLLFYRKVGGGPRT